MINESIARREFFTILGISAATAQNLFAQHAVDFSAYQPRAFTPSEFDLLDALAETLLPADETGPGAHDAHVAYYIDVVLTHAPPPRRLSWKSSLALVQSLVDQHFRQPFTACSVAQRQQFLAELASRELTPQSDLDRFFVEFKRTVVDGFYASDLIRREHLGYKGNIAAAEFPGCPHPNFEHPS